MQSCKCLNVREWVEVVEWSTLPCCPVNRQRLWKKNQIEKKYRKSKSVEILDRCLFLSSWFENFQWATAIFFRRNAERLERFLLKKSRNINSLKQPPSIYYLASFVMICNHLLTLPASYISGSCSKIKIKFLFSHFFVMLQKCLRRPSRPS